MQVPELVPPLVRTLAAAFALPSPPECAILAHQTRSHATDALFWALLKESGLTATAVPPEQHHTVYRHPDIQLWVLRPGDPSEADVALSPAGAGV